MSHPQPIGNIIPKVMQKLGLGQKVKELEIVTAWVEIVGEAVAGHCMPVALDKGCLTVNVDSSPWLNELERFSKDRILDNIQQRLGKKTVTKMRFRIGNIS